MCFIFRIMTTNRERDIKLIKDAVKSFRIIEIKESLKFLRLPSSNGRKAVLQERLIKCVEEKFKRVPSLFLEKILQLERRLNKTLQKRGRRRLNETFIRSEESPFFETVEVLLWPQTIRSRATLYLNIPNALIKLFHKRGAKRNYPYEVQVMFRSAHSDEWAPGTVRLKVNEKLAVENSKPPPIFYVTSHCSFRYRSQNKIDVEFPFNDEEFSVSVSIVKRISPSQLLMTSPPTEVSKAVDLVRNHLTKFEIVYYEVLLYCPKQKNYMRNPCRSSFCSHPEVFDVLFFLEGMQYHLTWKCPVCKKPITYESLEIDMFFKNYLENGKAFFTFYNKRKPSSLSDRRDPPFPHEEVITLD